MQNLGRFVVPRVLVLSSYKNSQSFSLRLLPLLSVLVSSGLSYARGRIRYLFSVDRIAAPFSSQHETQTTKEQIEKRNSCFLFFFFLVVKDEREGNEVTFSNGPMEGLIWTEEQLITTETAVIMK